MHLLVQYRNLLSASKSTLYPYLYLSISDADHTDLYVSASAYPYPELLAGDERFVIALTWRLR
jgi:hypothetical protein